MTNAIAVRVVLTWVYMVGAVVTVIAHAVAVTVQALVCIIWEQIELIVHAIAIPVYITEVTKKVTIQVVLIWILN